ncbi:MAG: magnesium transporter [Gemmatimonadota bacterium]
MAQDPTLTAAELLDAWPVLSPEERAEGFALLQPAEAASLFESLSPTDQADLLAAMPAAERRTWIRLLAPDDCADLIQAAEPDQRAELIALLDDATRADVSALLAYAEDAAGGVMDPRFPRVRPDMRIDEAIPYLRKQAIGNTVPIHYAYVLDAEQHVLGVLSFRDLLSAPPDARVDAVMTRPVVSVLEDMDQEAVARVFAEHHFVAIPVVDRENRMKGVVTADDIVDVVEEEATEDIQKMGGSEVLGAPYLDVSLADMVRKRAWWLAALFIGEMLTATAMGRFQDEIARAVVLALFVPLIISSGGNSGSQATTLVIRAMALGEVRLRDWWRVCRREVVVGLGLGLILATLGILRITVWHAVAQVYGEHWLLLALAVGASLVGVVAWGTIAGAMLPFFLRRLGFDPASASAPFVATLVDVTGLIIYFTVSAVILRGTLL